MTPIPGEPLQPQVPELTTSDGRKVKLKLPGLKPPEKPRGNHRGFQRKFHVPVAPAGYL